MEKAEKFEIQTGDLRSCLDWQCHEYKRTNVEQKVEILREHLKHYDASKVLHEYAFHYMDIGKSNVLDWNCLGASLMVIVKHLLEKEGK